MVAPIQAVLFDLDDTLLYNDMERSFLPHYFAALAAYARPVAEPRVLMGALHAATEAMLSAKPGMQSNEDTFAAVFAPALGQPWAELRVFFSRFYETEFPKLASHAHAHPHARRAVQACLDAGYRTVIATNPLFPARAIEHRMAWAGVDDLPFTQVTSYENMRSCKPFPAYYAEIATQLALESEQCLMVGNDVQRDIEPAQATGMRTFLADEWLIGKENGIVPDGRGTLDEFINWLSKFRSEE